VAGFSEAMLIRLRRALRILSAGSVTWAGLVWLTGGFYFEIGILRLSSRDPLRPLLTALVGAAVLAAVSWTIDRWNGLAEEWTWWRERAGTVGGAARARWPWFVRAAPALVASVIAVLEFRRMLVPTPLWLDEETIALNLRDRTFGQLGGPLWLGQSAPFGWLALERATILALGTSEAALRLPPVLFGVATVAGAAWLGRRWLEPSAAVTLVILCSASQWLSHFPLEVKHYTADACWALLLPALAVWATEAADERSRLRRAAIWWAAAAAGQWFANGAVLVTPACALFLVLVSWMNRGWRAAATTALLGVIWIASIGVHYEVAAQYTVHSNYLHEYWAAQMVPPSSGIVGGARWVIARLGPLSANPIGTGLPLIFWVSAASGFVFASRRRLGIVFATVPLSAIAAASLRLIPLYERFVLWAVPALYVGVVLVFDRAIQLGREAGRRRDWTRVALATSVVVAELFVSVDLYTRGLDNLALSRTDSSKHGFDDRTAVQWLIQHREPGDDLMTTRLGWPAVWWYGPFPIADPDVARGKLPDGGVMYEVEYVDPGPECDTNQLRNALNGHHRVLVHIGFNDFPAGFDTVLFGTLDQLGAVIEARSFGDLSRAAVVDLRLPGGSRSIPPFLQQKAYDGAGLRGCVGVRRAQPW
jgi:hypothetical protein